LLLLIFLIFFVFSFFIYSTFCDAVMARMGSGKYGKDGGLMD